MPLGFPLAMIAAKNGVSYIGIVTDADHHQDPMAYTFDFFKNHTFNIDNSKLMTFDIRSLPEALIKKVQVKNWKAALEKLLEIPR